MRRTEWWMAIGLAAALLAGCRAKPRPAEKDYSRELLPGQLALEKITDPAQIPDFSGAWRDLPSLTASIDQSLKYYAAPSSKRHFPYGEISHEQAFQSAKRFRELLAASSDGADFRRRVLDAFDVYRSVGCDGEGSMLFTGYCEPIYDGSPVRTDEFLHPLYRLPAELVKQEDGTPVGWKSGEGVGASPTREAFEGDHLLEGRGLELVWLRSPLDAYIVHVQGSARIRLPGGKEMRIGYAGKTEYPYTSIGQELVAEGKIRRQDLSLSAIRAYFGAHPDECDGYLRRNACYVFFTETVGGPYGSLGVPVTSMRTVATDKAVFPRGAVAFVETVIPRLEADGSVGVAPHRQFVCDQDTGGAIRSAGRADLFLGTGPEAELLAGYTQAEGRIYYFFLKPGEWAPPSNGIIR